MSTQTSPVGSPASSGADPAAAHRNDALLRVLSRRIVDRAVGADIACGTRLPDGPQGRLWLGMLASEPKLIAEAASGYTYGERLIPPAQGFIFGVPALPVTLDLTVSAAAYLALTPTLAEQKAAVTADTDTDAGGPGSGPLGPAAASGTGQGHRLAVTWSKVTLGPVSVTVTVDRGTTRVIRVAEAELADAFRAAMRPPAGATLFRPRRPSGPPGSLPRDADLVDEVTWSRYCAQNLTDAADLVAPEFRAAVEVELTPLEGGAAELLVTVVNTTPAPAQQNFDGSHPYDGTYFDSNLYEVQLAAVTPSPAQPYVLEQVADSYRYDRTVPALGHGCPVDVVTDHAGTTLRTLYAAQQETARVYPREKLAVPGQPEEPIDTTFTSLVRDPVGTVEKLVAAHRAWVDHHWSAAELDRLAAAHGWDAAARRKADTDAASAREEVDWVAAGLELLRTNTAVREAFVLANRTVQAAAGGAYDSWRPFQVAWLVGCLPGMVDPAAHLEVAIVWFATGGGKSEAYLGLMVTTLFYGRLTGVTSGAQVWARFPLRLLALQQAERFASMVLNAELLRRADPRMAAGERFGVGYFVGGGNTPNRLQRPDPTNPFYDGRDPYSPATAEACRVLETCPVCGEHLDMVFDDTAWSMQHVCRNTGCPMVGVLPVWGIDDDIYRNAPAVLVGTVDKLAQLGQAREFQVLLGRAHSRCPVHGYTGKPDWCAVFGCTASRAPVPAGFGSVRLEIADELHLLDESLGALDGMYETLLQTISESLGNPRMQIVGATATIEGYRNQVDHLYRRDARRFPVNGPTVGETFWSTTSAEEPLRRYVGVRPRNITMVTATREVAVTHAAWVDDLIHKPAEVAVEAGLDPTDGNVVAAVREAGEDLYEVLVAYCLRNEDLSSFTRDRAVRELLTSQDNLAVINGDAEPAAIRDAVRRLTDPPAADADRVKIIAATKAIGPGSDVHRLGVMAVMGTPTSASEIIQASARVGRRHPGLVVNVINPTRDRDASVYRYYADWIRFLDRLVQKVPVNRESLPVLKRVLSGGLMAWLLQVHDRTWITGAPRRRSLGDSVAFADAVQAGVIDRTLLVDNLTSGFGIDPASVGHRMHRAAVEAWVDDQLTALPLRAEAGKQLRDLLAPAVPRSLRDVEEPITIYGEI